MFHKKLAVAMTATFAAICGVSAAQDTAALTATKPEKIVFVFQKQKDPKAIQESADKVAEFLTKEIGTKVEVMVPTSYGATVQALISNKAQAAYASALPFLLAKAEAPVKMIVAEERNGKTSYNSIFVVAKDSPYQSLADLKGKRMVFTSPTSTSGYVMAFYRLIQDGLLKPAQDPKEFFSTVTFGGGYDKALLAVANGQADACAVSDYTMEGPKVDLYLKNKEDRDKLRILAKTPGVPTHGVCVRTDLPQDLQDKLQAALLKLSEQHSELLADVYGASKFTKVGDDHVEVAAKAIKDTGLDIKEVTKGQ